MHRSLKLLLLAGGLAGSAALPLPAADEASAVPSKAPTDLPELPAFENPNGGLPLHDQAPPDTLKFTPPPNDELPVPTPPKARKRIPTEEEIEARKKEENWVLEAMKARTESSKSQQPKDPYREEVDRQLQLQKFGPLSPNSSLSNSSHPDPSAKKENSGFMKVQPLQPSISQNALGGPQNYSSISTNRMEASTPFNPSGNLSKPQVVNPMVTPASSPLQPILGPQPTKTNTVRSGNILLEPLAPGGIRKLSSDPNYTPSSTIKVPVFNGGTELQQTGGISPLPSGLNSGINRQQLNLDTTPERRPTPIDIHNTIPAPTSYNRFK